jgi:hypothetical protein
MENKTLSPIFPTIANNFKLMFQENRWLNLLKANVWLILISTAMFIPIAAIAALLGIGAITTSLASKEASEIGSISGIIIIGFLVAIVTFILIGFSLAYNTAVSFEVFQGNKISLKKVTSESFKRMWPFLGLLLIQVLIIFFGYIFFIVPGVILAIVFMFSFIAMYDDKKGVFASMKRSNSLTEGYRIELFKKGFVIAVASFILSGITGLFAGQESQNIAISLINLVIAYAINTVTFFILLHYYFELKAIKGSSSTTIETAPITPASVATEQPLPEAVKPVESAQEVPSEPQTEEITDSEPKQ